VLEVVLSDQGGRLYPQTEEFVDAVRGSRAESCGVITEEWKGGGGRWADDGSFGPLFG
jgi:hypothetical protein